MAKKGKEIDLGGVRLQVDPFILARRILMRQKLLLAIVAVIGGVATAAAYKNQDKIYTSSAQIAIRTENMDEAYSRKLVNRAMRDLNSDLEMMLIINELDLFASTRASLPYEMALRRMRQELRINNAVGNIGVQFDSKSAVGAKDVVAFVAERVLGTLANLLDSPYRRQLEALDRGIAEIQPKVKDAQSKLFQFKEKYPEVAVTTPDFIRQDSPLAAVDTRIQATEQDMRRCYAGVAPTPTKKKTTTTGPACQLLRSLRAERDALLAQYTASHPSVVEIVSKIARQESACTAEQAKSDDSGGYKPGMSQSECIEAVKTRLAALHRQKVDIQKKSIKKPILQQKWATLQFEAAQLESQLRAMKERRSKTLEDRLVAANEFQENFQLVDPPRIPELPTKPERNLFLMTGMAITALLGLLGAAGREALRQTFLDPQEFEEQTGLQVLAVLPDISED